MNRQVLTWGAVLAAVVAVTASQPAAAQAGRLLLGSSVSTRDDHIDLTLEFGCTLRYQTHSPAAEGADIRVSLQPGPDCGMAPLAQFPTEIILPADDVDHVVRVIELTPGLTGGAELHVGWNRVEKFVLAPTAGMGGLRVRVIRQKQTGVSLIANDDPGAQGTYAVNLRSQDTPVDPRAIERARDLLKVPVYVSTAEVGGQTWYRLRAGPFFASAAAERVLREAQKNYTGVWLGIDDEPKTVDSVREELPAAAGARVPAAAVAENRADPALDTLLDQARKANGRKQYAAAVPLLEKILLSPDYLHRIDAQELLGLVRERNSQLAQAKAEYEEYLRRYPDGKAADRVRQRLRALRMASMPGRRGTGGGADEEGVWRLYGSIDQTYRRDNSQLRAPTISRDFVSQDAVISGLDFVARRRGARFDFMSRINGGYLKDLMPNGRGDQERISVAYAELRDRELGWGAKVGRQSRGMAGVFGSFDGVLGTWQARQRLGLSAIAGSPVESSRSGFDPNRRFVGVAADFGTKRNTWDTSVYAIAQQYYGITDRQSIGVESRYLRPGRTLVALLDYDVNFSDINNAMLLGTLVLPHEWTVNASAGRQRSPSLSLRNALIGQQVGTFAELQQQFTDAQIAQFARDRTAALTQGSANISHPLGERIQWTLSAYVVDITGTPSSGGVEAIPAFGLDKSLTNELLVNSLFKAGDVSSMALRFQQGGGADTISLGVSNRLPIGNVWRLTSRLRADRRTLDLTGTEQWLYAPSMRLDLIRGRGQFELEAGAEFGNRTTGTITERNTRYFFSLGYRLSLDTFTQK